MSINKKLVTLTLAALFVLGFTVAGTGCGDDENGSQSDADADSDTDSDTDTDADSDPETDPEVLQDHCPTELVEKGKEWVCTVSETITDDQKWIPEISYVLQGLVFIGDGTKETTLTIEPGTVIYGDTTSPSSLIIQRNSKIYAVGTSTNPIVFTSAKAEGDRNPSDWGGVVINGNAPINICASQPCEATGECDTGLYGGDNPKDNSGEFAYVRIEFAGYQYDPETEFNGLALQGVGSGTKIHHIQIHKCSDDSLEFFGGTANVSHIVLTGTGDDLFDWTQGWNGKAQFVCAQQHADIQAERGIEADNLEQDNDASPRAKPILSNFTLIGQKDNAGDTLGIKLRRGTAGNLSNFVIMGFDQCINIDNDATWAQVTSGAATIDYSIIPDISCLDDQDSTGNLESDWWNAGTGNIVGDSKLQAPQNETAPNFMPKTDSPVLGAGQAPSDSFFDNVDFIGCMGTEDWTKGWTDYPTN